MASKGNDNNSLDILLTGEENVDIIVYRVADDIYTDEGIRTAEVMQNVVKILRNGITLILDLTEVEDPERDRVLTSARGASHYLDGIVVQITEDVYLITEDPIVKVKQWPMKK